MSPPWQEAISTQVAGSLYGSLKLTSMWYPVRELPGEISEVPALVRLLWCCGPGQGGRGWEVVGESWQNLLIQIAGKEAQ